MEILSIAFIGKTIGYTEQTAEKLEGLIRDLAASHDYTECMVTAGNDFNFLVSETIERLKPFYDGNLEHTLVLPYGGRNKKKKDFTYDRVEFADIMENEGEEISLLNRWMIESADILVCCVPEEDIPTKEIVQYAADRKIPVYNLAENWQ